MIKMFETRIRRDNNDKTFISELKSVKNNDQRALLITQFTNKYQIDRNNRFKEDNYTGPVLNSNFNKASLKTFI